MNLEEALKTAVEYETKVIGVYKDALTQVTDEVSVRVFTTLVKEEQYHLDYLNKRLEELFALGKIELVDLETAIPSKQAIESEIAKLKTKLSVDKTDKKYADTELRMLKKALEVEIETSDFYKRMVLELTDTSQELFMRFLEIEEGHKSIVQAEIDAVTGMGYWFDIPEFNLASG